MSTSNYFRQGVDFGIPQAIAMNPTLTHVQVMSNISKAHALAFSAYGLLPSASTTLCGGMVVDQGGLCRASLAR
jgi:hypothetical protein